MSNIKTDDRFYGTVIVGEYCGCYDCNDNVQPGHIFCHLPSEHMLRLEEAGAVKRHLRDNCWEWIIMSNLEMIVSGAGVLCENEGFSFKENSKPLYLPNGQMISVQASRNHYSTPRNDRGPYSELEVGSLIEIPALEKYIEIEPTKQEGGHWIYAYVPVEEIRALF